MSDFKIKVKGVVKNGDHYLLVKKWYDDNISQPFQWEFVDALLKHGDSPEQTVKNAIEHMTGLHTEIQKILYTWSYMIGETQYIGITYLCEADNDLVFLSEDLIESVWISKWDFGKYIDNKSILEDIEKALK